MDDSNVMDYKLLFSKLERINSEYHRAEEQFALESGLQKAEAMERVQLADVELSKLFPSILAAIKTLAEQE